MLEKTASIVERHLAMVAGAHGEEGLSSGSSIGPVDMFNFSEAPEETESSGTSE